MNLRTILESVVLNYRSRLNAEENVQTALADVTHKYYQGYNDQWRLESRLASGEGLTLVKNTIFVIEEKARVALVGAIQSTYFEGIRISAHSSILTKLKDNPYKDDAIELWFKQVDDRLDSQAALLDVLDKLTQLGDTKEEATSLRALEADLLEVLVAVMYKWDTSKSAAEQVRFHCGVVSTPTKGIKVYEHCRTLLKENATYTDLTQLVYNLSYSPRALGGGPGLETSKPPLRTKTNPLGWCMVVPDMKIQGEPVAVTFVMPYPELEGWDSKVREQVTQLKLALEQNSKLKKATRTELTAAKFRNHRLAVKASNTIQYIVTYSEQNKIFVCSRHTKLMKCRDFSPCFASEQDAKTAIKEIGEAELVKLFESR